ncbi:carbohydrate kinase family protein [Demequina sp. NBRC 110057]|uniref:carbohydrate kinase family protein n=1 Tax=Demequina sp. NBRC 110057 TaxID=1570346 RepID=UPI0009FFF03D|nr:carbohydrate kinase family protein [Demequina sp. NBRC 110057]
MRARPRIVVCGPASWNHLIELDALPEPRPHMRFARHASWTVGGTSAGKALHLLDLGADVTLVTPLARDDNGRRLRTALVDTGLDTVVLDADVTESHTNLMTPEGGRVSLYTAAPGPPTASDIAAAIARFADADALVIDMSPVGLAVLPAARAIGLPLWTDVHDWDGRESYHLPFAQAGSTVLLNDDGPGDTRAIMADAVAGHATLAIRTLGADGAEALTRDGAITTVPATACEVVDTNGAGDAFAAGALMAQLAGESVRGQLTAGAHQAVRALTSRHLSPLLG